MAAKRKKTKTRKKGSSRKRTKAAPRKRAKAAPRKRAKAAPRKRAQPKKAQVAPAPVIAQEPSASDLEEAIAEPLADVSGVFRVSEQIAKTQRGRDEDEDKLFRDPSLVIEIEKLRDKRKIDD